jgi:hypothetical protein
MKTINDAMVEIIESEMENSECIISERNINKKKCKSIIRYAVDFAVDDSKDIDRSVSDYINRIQIICKND